MTKRVGIALSEADFRTHPVWRFDDEDEMQLSPVIDLPVADLTGCVIGADVYLADGERVFAVLSNVSLSNKRATEQFLYLEALVAGVPHSLPRYFDDNWDQCGPAAFAAALGKSVSAVFPITYDLSRYCKGDRTLVTGSIDAEPRERLSEGERLELIMADL